VVHGAQLPHLIQGLLYEFKLQRHANYLLGVVRIHSFRKALDNFSGASCQHLSLSPLTDSYKDEELVSIGCDAQDHTAATFIASIHEDPPKG
jgi:hypothetical protein